ncbi:V-set domain-containing T-cell activation inhibitor 1-like [Maylandia zebra]|uniref:V-set domain-containing T-cell activation inhibitor 1-like n=1 Tax=Maylandia zebra TaxID=106582 RepID=UPI00403C6580
MAAPTSTPFFWFGAFCVVVFVSADHKTITAKSGQNVILTCQTPNNNILVVEWSRADLGDEYVFVFRDGQFDPANQHPSFKNRVGLQDRQMKDGDVSLILKDVTTSDAGTYECRVIQIGATRSNTGHISIISLKVVPPGQPGGEEDGSFGLIVGLTVSAVLLVAAVAVFVIYRKRKNNVL